MIRVLIVDRHEIWRVGVSKILAEQPDIEVVDPCGCIDECLQKVAQFSPDIVLLDTDLQELSYIKTIQRICESAPKAKVIMLTHSENEQDVYHAVNAGAKGYLSKDIGIEELVKALFLVARGEVVLSSVVAAKVLEEFTEFYPQRQHIHQRRGFGLTEREREVLALVADGASNRSIASSLYISENTVKVHLRNIMKKLHCNNRLQAAARALEEEVLYSTGQPRSNQS